MFSAPHALHASTLTLHHTYIRNNDNNKQLRAHEARLAALVDAIAAGHHAGFAASIQAYGRILQLFGDAAAQIEGLKRSLADAHRQLALQTRHLHQQWRKGMMLEAQTRLLADVRLAVDAPARVEEALAARDWAAAVSTLQAAAARLARDSLGRILALRKVRADVAAACASVQAQLLQELHLRVYGGGGGGGGGGLTDSPSWPTAAGAGGGGAAAAGPGSRPGSPRRLAGSGGSFSADSGGSKGAARRSRLAVVDGGGGGSGGGGGDGSGGGAAAAGSFSSPRAAAAAAAATTMPQFVADALAERDQGDHGARLASLRELIACLVQIDGLEEAKTYLTLHARGEVRRMVRRAIEAWAAGAEERAGSAAALAAALAPERSVDPLVAAAGRGGGAASSGEHASPALKAATAQLFTAVFDQCLRALANLGQLLQEIADAPTAASAASSSHALVRLKQQHLQGRQPGDGSGEQQLQQGQSAPPPPPQQQLPPLAPPLHQDSLGKASFASGLGSRAASSAAFDRMRALGGPGYVRAEYEHAWEQMQEEVQLLLAELLHSQLSGPPASAHTASRLTGWLSDLAGLANSAAAGLSGSGGSGNLASALASAASAGLAAAAGQASGANIPHSSSLGALAPALSGSSNSLAALSGGADSSAAAGMAGGAGRLTFSLDIGGAWLDSPQLQRATEASVAGAGGIDASAAAAGSTAEQAVAASREAYSYGPLLTRALGGQRAGAYLTPAVYGPVKRFVEDALVVMRSSAAAGGAAGADPESAGDAVGGDEAVGPEPGEWLLSSLETHVSDTFLPRVWVDLRGRCTAMLEDPDAFRPATVFAAAAGEPSAGNRGRPARSIVPAATFAAKVVEEVMGWVRDIPCASSKTLNGAWVGSWEGGVICCRVGRGFSLQSALHVLYVPFNHTGVVDAILGNVLESFASTMVRVLGDSRAHRLVLRPDVGLVMAGEPDAPLLGDPMAFYVPRSQNLFDGAAFLTSLKSQGDVRLGRFSTCAASRMPTI